MWKPSIGAEGCRFVQSSGRTCARIMRHGDIVTKPPGPKSIASAKYLGIFYLSILFFLHSSLIAASVILW